MDLRVLAVLILFAPTAAAVPMTVVTDPAADTELGDAGSVTQRWKPLDLLRLDLDETGQSFRFLLHVATSEDMTRTLTDEMEYDIWFRHGTIVYQVAITEWISLTGFSRADADLRRYDEAGGRGHFVAGLQAVYEVGSGVIVVDVPRHLVVDKDDVEPFRGSLLRDIFVESRLYWADWGINSGASPQDRMPDAANGEAPVRLGTEQVGHVRLSSEGRIRGSNGEATTFLWTVNLTNLEEYPDTFTLSLSTPPPAWEVRLPYPKAQVPANSSVQIPILATIPFAHQHGAVETFVLEARSLADGDAVGRLDLGVEYLAPAQPAGHHDTLFIHGRGSDSLTIYVSGDGTSYSDMQAYMNTRPPEPEGDARAIQGRVADCSSTSPRFGWVAELEPQLRLGLDFDMDGEGLFEGEFTTPLPIDDARLHGRLLVADHYGAQQHARYYDAPAGTITVATLSSETGRDLGQGSTTALQAVITPTDEGDLVPFQPEQSLLLVLWLTGESVPACIGLEDQAMLEAGASLKLPLFEYHDPIDASFAAPDFISLISNGPVTRDVPAGGAGLWNLTLRNDGEKDRTFEVTVSGQNTDWVRLPGGDLFLAPGNSSIAIPVAIAPPEGTRQGEKADIIVEAVNVKDPRMRGLLRIVGTVAGVTDGSLVQDDTEAVQAIEEAASKKSPALPAALLLGVLAIAVLRRR